MRFTLVIGLAGSIAAAGLPAAAQSFRIEGNATIVDGDTLRIGDERIRLLGIDAPERKQTCSAEQAGATRAWPCGEKATQHLQALVAGRRVVCVADTRDRYGRAVAVCTADGREINDDLARAGMAVATPEYSTRYVAAEAEARAHKRGLWAGRFELPADYRRERR